MAHFFTCYAHCGWIDCHYFWFALKHEITYTTLDFLFSLSNPRFCQTHLFHFLVPGSSFFFLLNFSNQFKIHSQCWIHHVRTWCYYCKYIWLRPMKYAFGNERLFLGFFLTFETLIHSWVSISAFSKSEKILTFNFWMSKRNLKCNSQINYYSKQKLLFFTFKTLVYLYENT